MANDKKSSVTNLSNKTFFRNWKVWITMILRIIVGVVFVFSGFVKSIDPWGTIYKLHDYAIAIGLNIWDNLLMVGSFGLFSIEFLVGIFLIFGCYRKVCSIVAVIIMLFMTPLTLWIAISNPVADCGCFGDAFVISNWATFYKNIFLLLMTLWLVKYNYKSRCFIIPTLQWLAFIASSIFIILIGIYGYVYQPLIDFRPYKIGETLLPNDNNETAINYEFIYEKDGITKTFLEDNLPGDDWTFVDRKIISDESVSSDKRVLAIYEGSEEVTDYVVLTEGRQLILFYSSLNEVSIASSYQINSLYDYCHQNGIDMISVISATSHQIEEWKDLSMAAYPIYTSEDTSIKEVVRGNPGIVYLEDGVIMWKSSLKSIDTDDFLLSETSNNPMSFAHDNNKILSSCISTYILVMIIITILSHVPMVIRYARRKRKNKSKSKPIVNNKLPRDNTSTNE